MQTLKTATIVALLMTVMYGGYVSLTTPPEQIPPEYRDLLVIDDNLGMDSQISQGSIMPTAPAIGPSEFQPTFAGSSSNTAPLQPGIDAINNATSNPDSGFGSSFAPPTNSFAPPTNTAAPQPAATISLGPATGQQSSTNTQNRTLGSAPAQLPRVTMPAQPVSVDMNRDYPATQRGYQQPAPTASHASFDPNRGRAFGVPNALPAMDSGLPDIPEVPSLGQNQVIDLPQTKQVSLNADPYVPEVVAPPESFQPTAGQDSEQGTIQRASRSIGLDNAIKSADRQYANDQVREALATLSVFYDTPNVLPEQRQQLLSRLDPLARDVIYSKRHLLDQSHRVGGNETLMEIADNYRVPWQLLANINGIQDPLVIAPGTDLKVVRGPFSARVDLSSKELTLFVGDLYAGRFPIEVGDSPMPRPGTFTVQDKQSRQAFQDGLGNTVPAGSPGNPYGTMWIGLGSQLCIHGSPSETNATNKGCISLPGELADDLFGILVQGSSVTIRQ